MTNGRTSHSEAGFALILTLSLLSLLVLLTFAISSVTKVDSQITTTAVYQNQSKQNALIGLKIALGELQRYAGPDDRMTGMAGVVGVSDGDSTRQWTGVWGGSPSPVWLSSGSTGSGVPGITGNRFVIVGENSVGSPTDRTDQELVEIGLIEYPAIAGNYSSVTSGQYGYWVGDEGAKISAVILDTDVQTSLNTGRFLKPDILRMLVRNFNPSNAELLNMISMEQLVLPVSAKGASLKNAFHSLTLVHKALPLSAPLGVPASSGYVVGALNVNTTSAPVWRALLEYPDRYNSAYGLSTGSTLNNSRKITQRIVNRGAPFSSIGDFVASSVVLDSFAVTPNRVSSPTATEFIDDVGPMLAVRSDTFRIRAYGSAFNLLDAGQVEAAAYCEAIVQRIPELLDSAHPEFGRRFVITYFRWLGPDDI